MCEVDKSVYGTVVSARCPELPLPILLIAEGGNIPTEKIKWLDLAGPLFAQCFGSECPVLSSCWMPFLTAPVGEVCFPRNWELEVLKPAGGGKE